MPPLRNDSRGVRLPVPLVLAIVRAMPIKVRNLQACGIAPCDLARITTRQTGATRMGNGYTASYESQRPHAAEVVPAGTCVRWVAYAVALTLVVAIALVCVPWVIVWCLLFDPD